MIVRNEAAILRRCLESVKPLISSWVIADTGSTDSTRTEIRACLDGIPGVLLEQPWVNFAHNRSLVMKEARGKAEYHLLIDADMVVNQHSPLPELTADAYFIRFGGLCDYSVIRLVNDRHLWYYEGVTHEYICSNSTIASERLPELSITHFEDGASRAVKWARDIELLKKAVAENPDHARYTYYLAQSYRDTRQFAKALEWYAKRATMPGWEEETWHAIYQSAKMQAEIHTDWRMVQHTYLQAYNFRPTRLEPIYQLANFYREQGQFALGYQFARLATEVPYPADILFIERDVYDYLLPLEFAMCCQGTGRSELALKAFDHVLAAQGLPDKIRLLAEQGAKSRGQS